MKKELKIFRKLDIETCSSCNRVCSTCLRNTDPEAAKRSRRAYLPSEIVYDIVDQAVDMGHKGKVCFQWFNEPLMDDRLIDFILYAKNRNLIPVLNTNGDFLSREMCEKLDGNLRSIRIALYDKKSRSKSEFFKRSFSKTRVTIVGEHIVSHYSPSKKLNNLIESNISSPCWFPRKRMIITHTGEMALCCDDISCNFGLGRIQDTKLRDLWFGEPHYSIIMTLSERNGRKSFPHCRDCPRINS